MMTGDSASNGNNGGAHGLHLVMFPFLAFGHISPFIQLSRKLAAVDPAIRITFLTTPGNVSRISTSLLPSSGSSGAPTPSINNRISIRSLPLPPVPGLPPGAESTADLPNMAQAELLKTAVDAMKPDVGALLSHLRPHFVVFDFAMPWIPSVCSPLGINSLFFTVFSAIANAYLMVPSRRPLIHDMKMPPPGFPPTSAISIAGGVPAYQAQDFSYVFKTFGGGDNKLSVYDRFVACMTGCSAIITKTCTEMEGRYISYLESEYNKPVLLAGPVVPQPAASGPGEVLEERWAKWLDKFEKGSVIYCSFGSETSLTEEATRELILGLQMTNMPYFVVLINNNNLDDIMVESDRGLVHSGWVQQQLILRHESVGCYVNHGGFSSVVEGLVAGCQLVMLPQRGDQYLNSVLFAGELGIGVEVERDETTGAFKKEGVCEAVKKVMIMKEEEVSGGYERWKEFFTDKDMEEQFIMEFVKKLKGLF